MKIISEQVINELKKNFCTLVGFFLISLDIILLIGIATYSPFNSSLNTISSFNDEKFFYLYCTSDILVQFFGYAVYVITIVLFAYSITLFKNNFVHSFIKRLCATFFATISLSVILTSMKIYSGIFGYVIFKHFSNSIMHYKLGSFFLYTFLILFFALNFLYAIGINIRFSSIKKRINETSIDIKNNFVPTLEKVKITKQSNIKVISKTKTSFTFSIPPISLLNNHEKKKNSHPYIDKTNELKAVLNDFGIKGTIVNIKIGPIITLYEFEPAPGIKASRIISLSSDIARSISAISVRISTIPGKNVLGIEIPNQEKETIFLRELLESSNFQNSKNQPLGIILGKNICGEPVIVDLTQMPHLLIAGTTGSGKSVSINAMILSILYKTTPEECKFIMIDPKMLELSVYDGIPHLITPVVTDPKSAVSALKWAVKEMERRYQAMSKLGVRNIQNYNEKVNYANETGENLIRQVQTGFDENGNPIYEKEQLENKTFPYIVIIVDEMADLMLVAGKEIEIAVQRLAQMARAAGIHLIMATQRPSVDVITGTIKANFPTRISFHVTSKIDSRTILGEQGAEQLLGKGDMLYMSTGGMMTRVHAPFVEDSEVETVVNFLKAEQKPVYIDEILMESDDDISSPIPYDTKNQNEDPLYQDALNIILKEGRASTSFIQRQLRIGYNRAANIVELMEKRGILSEPDHIGRRKIL